MAVNVRSRTLEYRRINRLSVLPLFLTFATTICVGADPISFEFMGISAATTFAEIREIYPDSAFSDGYVRVSQSDTHDHVFSVSVSTQRVRIGFQKTDFDSGHKFPACDSVSQKLVEVNGDASESQEFYEVATLSKRIIWRSENVTMVLQCFQRDEKFLAEAVSFWKNQISE